MKGRMRKQGEPQKGRQKNRGERPRGWFWRKRDKLPSVQSRPGGKEMKDLHVRGRKRTREERGMKKRLLRRENGNTRQI